MACSLLPGRQIPAGPLAVTLATIFVMATAPAVCLSAADSATAEAQEKLLQLYQSESNITNSLGAIMVWIPAGYRVARTEVTQAQYQKVMGANPSNFKGPSHPVEMVSPSDAKAFCRKLTETEQADGTLPKEFAYGLPTQAEFDTYVADTPLETAFVSYIGDRRQTTTVGSLAPNPMGLHDVRGNVWEWCDDNVARGASYQSHEDYLAPGFRFVGNADMRIMDIGFRVVLRETGG